MKVYLEERADANPANGCRCRGRGTVGPHVFRFEVIYYAS